MIKAFDNIKNDLICLEDFLFAVCIKDNVQIYLRKKTFLHADMKLVDEITRKEIRKAFKRIQKKISKT
tara:strand:+ start:37024 stop:37227 length:204 start_codon:yes stop_codon:yes gene_type:complete